MALIKCPECNREVSDKAVACPACGYPISASIAEQKMKEAEEERLKEEAKIAKERAELLDAKKNEYGTKKEYFLFGRKAFEASRNERICSTIGADYYLQVLELHQTFFDYAMDYKLGQAMIKFDGFRELWSDCLHDMITRPFVELDLNLFDLLVESNEPLRDELVSRLQNVDYSEVYDSLEEVWEKAGDKYFSVMNDVEAKTAETLQWQTQPLVDAVYASSFEGLIRGKVQAAAINGFHNAILAPFDIANKMMAKKDYKNAISIETFKYSAAIFGAMDRWVEPYAATHKSILLDILENGDELFETIVFPKDGYESMEHLEDFTEEDLTTEEKKDAFVEVIKMDPGNAYLYIDALNNILLDEHELDDISVLINDYHLQPLIENVVNDKKGRIYAADEILSWLKGDVASNYLYLKQLKAPHLKMCDGDTFQSVEEKDLYLNENKGLGEQIDEFYDLPLSDLSKFEKCFEKLKSADRPQSKLLGEELDEAISDGLMIINELRDNAFIDDIKYSLPKLVETYTPEDANHYDNNVHPISLVDSVEKRDEYFHRIVKAGVEILPSEMPLVVIGHTYVISTRAIYKWDYHRGSLDFPMEIYTKRFVVRDLLDIEIDYGKNDVKFKYSFMNNGETSMDFHSSSNEIFKTVADFADKLKRYITSEDFQEIIQKDAKERDSFVEHRIKELLIENKNNPSFDPCFAFKFRVLFKTIKDVNWSRYRKAPGYDFEESAYAEIPASIREHYERNNEYILHVEPKSKSFGRDVMITDKAVYINAERIPLDSFYSVSVYETGVNDTFNYSVDRTAVVFEDNTPKGHAIYFSGKNISEMNDFRSLKYIYDELGISKSVILENGGTYCCNCGNRHITKGVLTYKCENCNNKDASDLMFGRNVISRERDSKIKDAIYGAFRPNGHDSELFHDENVYKALCESIGIMLSDEQGHSESELNDNSLERNELIGLEKSADTGELKKEPGGYSSLKDYIEKNKQAYFDNRDVLFSFNFRKRFNAVFKGDFGSYDFDPEMLKRIRMERLFAHYEPCGDYIIYSQMFDEFPIILTDRYLYWGEDKFSLMNVREIVHYNQILGFGEQYYTKYAAVIHEYDKKTITFTPSNKNIKAFIYAFNVAIKAFLHNGYQLINEEDKIKLLCGKCKSEDLGGVLKYKCNSCGNVEGSSLFMSMFTERKSTLSKAEALINEGFAKEEYFSKVNSFWDTVKDYADEKKLQTETKIKGVSGHDDGIDNTESVTTKNIVDEAIVGEPEKTATKRKICPHCGKEVLSSVKFCNFCGEAISQDNQLERVCPSCGKSAKAGAKFCTFCGGKLD